MPFAYELESETAVSTRKCLRTVLLYVLMNVTSHSQTVEEKVWLYVDSWVQNDSTDVVWT